MNVISVLRVMLMMISVSYVRVVGMAPTQAVTFDDDPVQFLKHRYLVDLLKSTKCLLVNDAGIEIGCRRRLPVDDNDHLRLLLYFESQPTISMFSEVKNEVTNLVLDVRGTISDDAVLSILVAFYENRMVST